MRLSGWLALGAILLAAAVSPAGAEPGRPLRVVTYNLFHGGASSGLSGDGHRLDARLEMVVRELRALDPDVIGLQEASAGRGRGNVAERVARALGFHYAHAPATSRVFSFGLLNRFVVWLIGFAEGPAVLSRFPIAAHAVHDLPRCQRYLDPRVVLHAEVDSPWGRLDVFSTHTSRDACQHRHVAELVVARRGPLPAVVMGDFNAAEGSPGITALTEGAGLVDAFRVANPATPGLTVWQRVEVPASTVFRRVDYVFVLPGTRVPGRVRASRVVLDAPQRFANGAALWPSDHYGVLAELELGTER